MAITADSIRDQQRLTWDRFAAGWKKWDAELIAWHRPFGDAVIEDARLRPDSVVLDVAAGSGEPGLTVAALVPGVEVVLADISAGMLQVAEEKAAAQRLGNVRFSVCAAADLPFDDGTFDAVLCRFGFMFFPKCGPRCGRWCGRPSPGGESAPPSGAGPRKTPGQVLCWAPWRITPSCRGRRPGPRGCFAARLPGS